MDEIDTIATAIIPADLPDSASVSGRFSLKASTEFMTTVEIIDRLKQATTNLVWTSESDYPFEVVVWDKGIEMTPAALFKDLTADITIETITLNDFFAPALQTEDWYGAEELANVDRYQELVNSIAANLSDVRVFRIGSIEIEVYIVGRTIDRDLVGLKTQVVET